MLKRILTTGMTLLCVSLLTTAAQAGSMSFDALVSNTSGDTSLLSGVAANSTITAVVSYDDATSEVLGLTILAAGHTIDLPALASVSGDLASGVSGEGSALLDGALAILEFDLSLIGGGIGSAATSGADPSFAFDLRTTIGGDATNDGSVGGSDFIALSAGSLTADFTGDGLIGGPDFIILSREFGRSAPSFSLSAVVTSMEESSGAVVPEPAGAALIVVGTLVVAVPIRRRWVGCHAV